MERSFFIKYDRYKTGIRFVIEGHLFSVTHDQERQPNDEIFSGIDGLLKLPSRLRILFPEPRLGVVQGDKWFAHLVQELIEHSEKTARRKRDWKMRKNRRA